MRGVFLLAAFLMLAPMVPASGQTVAQPAIPPAAPPTVPAIAPAALPPTEADVLALGMDIPGRMTVPVTISGSGPYPFTIDTGAERTVISQELASMLGLAPGADVRVTDIKGSSNVKTTLIPSLKVSSAGAEQIHAPTFRGYDLGAPGLLGLDSLKGHSLEIDFETNRLKLVPAKARRRGASSSEAEIVIRARSKFRQLIISEASYRGRPIFVILDTGTSVSLGNLAMLELTHKGKMPVVPITITSVTGTKLVAQYAQVRDVQFGAITFRNLPIAFADAAPFAVFGLQKKPALLLGMDALRLFRRVNIDFANREVRVAVPRPFGEPG